MHLISGPWDDLAGREMAQAEKRRLHKPENGVVCFDPDEDIAKVARYKGWSQAVQEKKWLEVYNQIMRVIQKKLQEDPENGSSIRIMCNGRKPPDPEKAGLPELLGNAMPGAPVPT